ncbi:MAG: manganese efflux pump [Clostridia bacterium]|nr:manganese efflux pump [Clostridia bacterium]
MDFISVLIIAVALAMDAFSIALSKGLCTKKLYLADGLKIALCFGLFQGFMPFLGWIVGSRFSSLIENYSHWVGFALLSFIGGKMIYESLKGDEQTDCSPLTFRSLIVLGVATSIDALAVGLTFALQVQSILTVLLYCLIIAVITFIISLIGYLLGNKLGNFIGAKAEILGGIVLIGIGLKMLIEKLI